MRFNLKSLVSRFARDERGATLVEYGIAVVLAVVVGTGGLITLANQVDANMDSSQTAMVPADNTNFTDCSGTAGC
jgi:pilus assembly protein Flp/PilA